MDSIENARFDVEEATASVETALELLQSMESDDARSDLQAVIGQLRHVKQDLDAVGSALDGLSDAKSTREPAP